MHWSICDDPSVTHFPAHPMTSLPHSRKHWGIGSGSAEITENNSEVIARTQMANFACGFILSLALSPFFNLRLFGCVSSIWWYNTSVIYVYIYLVVERSIRVYCIWDSLMFGHRDIVIWDSFFSWTLLPLRIAFVECGNFSVVYLMLMICSTCLRYLISHYFLLFVALWLNNTLILCYCTLVSYCYLCCIIETSAW